MVAGSVLLTIGEWDAGGYRWGPLVYLVATVLATVFTVVFIVPVNRALYEEIADEREFTRLLTRWVQLDVVRAGLWAVEWFAIALCRGTYNRAALAVAAFDGAAAALLAWHLLASEP